MFVLPRQQRVILRRAIMLLITCFASPFAAHTPVNGDLNCIFIFNLLLMAYSNARVSYGGYNGPEVYINDE